MSLTTRMVIYFLLVVMVAGAGFAYTVWEVNATVNLVENVNKTELPRLLQTSKVNLNVSDQIAALRGYYVYKNPQIISDYKKLAEENAKIEAELIQTSVDPEGKRLISEVKALNDKYSELAEKNFIPLVQAGKQEEALLTMREIAPVGKALNDKIEEYQAYRNKQITDALNEAADDAKQSRTAAITAAILAAVLGIAIGFFAARSIARPVNQLATAAEKLASGDLTQQVKVDRRDEIGHLATSFNAMVHQLKDLIMKINANAEQVAASSEELTANSEQSAQAANQVATSINTVANAATEQLAAANEASAVVEQMSAGIQQIAANTNQVAAQSAQAADKAKEGGKAVDNAVNQMGHIEETVNSSAKVVAKLGERSKEIGQIVDTISGIAGQTNLLALNAAIEAARAGEQGRGFAVVAEEVRKLAEQSQEAAKKIAALIGEIQGDTEKAVVAMNEGTREVKTGAEVVDAAGSAFREIVGLVSQVSSQVREISAAVQQMASGSQQIVDSVRRIDVLSKNSAGESQNVSAAAEEQLAAMEEIATSSQALAQMAQDLQSAVAKFRM